MPKLQFHLLEDEFVEWLQKGRTAKRQTTARTAQRYARYAAEFCEVVRNPLTTDSKGIAAWREEIEVVRTPEGERPSTVKTRNVKIGAVRAFFDFLIAKGLRKTNPALDVPMVRVAVRRPSFIAKDVLKTLFDAMYAAPEDAEVLQDRAILETLYGSGLRRTEAATLRVRNIESRDVLRVIGKGDKERRTMISPPQFRALRAWAIAKLGDERTRTLQKEIGDDAAFDDIRRRMPDAPLFYRTSGEPVPSLEDPGRFVWERVKRWFEAIGEERRVHDLRHSFVTHMLDAGGDLLMVADFVGHSNVATTRLYRGQGEETFSRAKSLHPRGGI